MNCGATTILVSEVQVRSVNLSHVGGGRLEVVVWRAVSDDQSKFSGVDIINEMTRKS
jgi:hypothetical protein